MRFEVRALCALFCVMALGCGAPEQTSDMGTECPAGQTLNPVSGMCVGEMAAADMTPDVAPDETPDMPEPDMAEDVAPDLEEDMPQDMTQEDMVPEDMTQDMGTGEVGTLIGTITRSTEPKNGGIGPVYVAMFERNPITNMMNPGLVAFQRIENVDFTDPATMVPYRLEDIPVRAEPYFITAFLDDNMTVDTTTPESAGPDRDDLVALDGIGSPSVTVDMSGETTLDLILNFAMIF